MKPVVYPYKMSSRSAKILAKELATVRVSPEGKFKNNHHRPIVNWGNSESPKWLDFSHSLVLNWPLNVGVAANKLRSFYMFKSAEVCHPDWTTEKEIAECWKAAGETIIARKTLTGCGGAGIVVCEEGDPLPDAPLYTLYFKKKHEYRVHVFNGEILDFQEKKRKQGEEDVNGKIRNHSNGWVFCRDNVVPPEVVQSEAIKAVASLGLTFGAVDVGYNVHYNKPCIFEVNTAPGIQGSTVESYVKAIKDYIEKY